ncbi:hypothetical protein H6G00_02000 [Leptolyngbya sp. FACHB-541]|uniref:hypothetical protein n=1 Tax=Leptolyngbya sp. FACHB-541 TaxID=2692810 RepID=UPI0016831678|nr:hypothetical protein [Leptolyngbya sp. FACHB-541]MBD1995405.1 hypothetical protein [Leptolyngbya sp. FACHB-541]
MEGINPVSAVAESNAVQLIISATDNASSIFKGATAQLSTFGDTASLVRSRFLELGTVVGLTSGGLLTRLAELSQVLGFIRDIFNSEAGQALFNGVKTQADAAVEQVEDLTVLLSSLAAGGSPFLDGILGKESQVEARTQSLARTIAQNLLKNIPSELKDNPLIGNALSGALNFGLDQFIESQLPGGINQISQGLAGGAAKSFFVPNDVKELLTGNFFNSLEDITARKIEEGLRKAYENLDAIALGQEDDAAALGAAIADSVAKGFQLSDVAAEALDEAYSKLSDLPFPINELAQSTAPAVKKLLTDQLKGLDEPFQNAIKQAISIAITGGDFKELRDRLLAEIQSLDEQSGGLVGAVGESLGGRLGSAFGKGFASEMLAQVGASVNKIDGFIRNSVDFVGSIPKTLLEPIEGVGAVFGNIAGFGEPLEVFGALQKGALDITEGIFTATQQLAFFSSGFQALQQFVVGGPFELLIGQSIRLREQLLATQSSLVATQQVLQNGSAIADPTIAIQALEAPINSAIDQLRKGSLELVGVTSNDLVDAFQIISGQIGNINVGLDEAAELTLSAAASMGTLGIPLVQARQEITSILQGTIDMNSIMAKSLGLTNQQVAQWKSQGRLYDELMKRFEAFRSGNALAAMSLGGLTSNIQEIFDEIGRKAGEPLLDPLLEKLSGLYEYLNQNLDSLSESIGALIAQVFEAVEQAFDALLALYQSTSKLLESVPQYLIKSLSSAIKEFALAIQKVIPIVQPAINVIAELAKQAYALGGPFLKIALQALVLQKAVSIVSGSFGVLFQTLPGVGEILFFLSGRSNSLVNTFASLTKQLGFGAAGFLTLGKYMEAIPGLAGLIAGKLGPFGGMLAGFLPQIAGFGITLAGLSRTIPGLDKVLFGLAKRVPDVVGALAGFVGNSEVLGGVLAPLAPTIQQLAQKIAVYAGQVDNAAFFNLQFQNAAKAAGAALRQQMLTFGLMSAGVFAALYIFDRFVLKNDSLLETLTLVGNALKKAGAAIYDFLTNPIVVATGIVVGLSVAIQAGLLPLIIQLSRTFATQAIAAVTNWAKTATTGVAAFSDGIRKAATMTSELFTGTISFQSQTRQLQQQLTAQSDVIEQAIADRTAQLQRLDDQLTQAGDDKRYTTRREGLGTQKRLVQGELDNLLSQRSGIAEQLKAAEAQMAATASKPILSGQAFNQFAQNVQGKATASLKQFQGVAQRLSGDTLIRLGQGLGKLGLDDFAIQTADAGNNLFALGKQTLESEKAQGGLLGAVKASSINIGNFQSKIAGAATGLKTFALEAKTAATSAISGFAAAVGPAFALVAAIAIVVESIGLYNKIAKSGEKFTDGLGDAVEEFQTKIDTLSRSIATLEGQMRGAFGRPIDYASERLKELEKDASWLSRLGDMITTAGTLGLGDNGGMVRLEGRKRLEKEAEGFREMLDQSAEYRDEISENWDALIDNEQELASLMNQKAEADAKNDEDESRRLANLIKDRQELAETQKGEIDARIEYLEEQKPLNAELADDLAEELRLLKGIRSEMEAINETQIKPPELPRLGGKYEQLQTQAAAAIKFLREGVGTSEQLEQKSQELFESTEQQIALGQISQEEAISRYELLATNASSSAEIQIKAQDAISGAVKASGEIQVQEAQTRQQQIQQLAADGALSSVEAERRISEATLEESGLRLEAIEAEYQKRAELRERELQDTLREIDQNIAAEETALAAAQGDPTAGREVATTEMNRLENEREEVKEELATLNAEIEKAKADAPRRGRGATEAKAEIDKLQEEATLLQNQIDAVDGALAQAERDYRNAGEKDPEAEQTARNNIRAYGEERRLATEALAAQDTEDRRRTNTQIEQEETTAAQTRAQIREQENQEILEDFDQTQQILDGMRTRGLVSEEESSAKSLEITNARLDEELAQIEEQRALLDENDPGYAAALRDLEAKESEIYKRRSDALKKFYAEQVAIADRARRRLLDTAALVETETNLLIQQTLNDREIQQLEADQMRLETADARAKEELEIEEARLAQLEAIPRYDDPEAEEERQQQIRQSRQRTSDLTLKIAETEYRRQELARKALQKRIDEQVQSFENKGQAATLALQQEQRAMDAIAKTYENQNKILETRKGLLEAGANLLNAQLNALSAASTTDSERKDIAQITAAIQLRTLDQRQAIEREILLLNQEQQRIALEREMTENRIAQIQNTADTAGRFADLAEVVADPESTPAQRQAAELQLVASIAEGQGLQQQGAELERSRTLQERLNQREIEVQDMNQDAERLNAETEFIDSLRSPDQRRRANRQRRGELLGELGISGGRQELRQASRSIATSTLADMYPGEFGRDYQQMPITPGVSTAGLMPQMPASMGLPPLPALTGANPMQMLNGFSQGIPELTAAMGDVSRWLESLGGLNFQQENTYINQFTGEDVNNGRFRNKVRQEVYDTNVDLAQQLQRRN